MGSYFLSDVPLPAFIQSRRQRPALPARLSPRIAAGQTTETKVQLEIDSVKMRLST